jgi:GGDEF domain-containing protein
VLTRIERGDHAGIMAQRIIDVLKRPVEVGGHDCSIGASIGISVFPSDSLLPEHLLKCADTAMYAVKQSGKEGFRFHQAP